jgi:diguanylate cyclase (GGDEF)-like protein
LEKKGKPDYIPRSEAPASERLGFPSWSLGTKLKLERRENLIMADNIRSNENLIAGDLRILLLGTEEQRREWSGMIGPLAGQIWHSPENIPDDAPPDLVITESGTYPNPEVGLIRIGGAGPANVHLPDEPSVRELHLACRLLAEIVQLRRHHQVAIGQQQQLHEAAYADPLTGLPNRRAWDKALSHHWQHQKSLGEVGPPVLVLAIFDLDDFKQVNEKQGHAAGDEVLKVAGSSILGSMRQGDLVARLGGDEFGLLLTVPQKSAAPGPIERARTAIPLRLHQSGLLPITASAGYACLNPKLEFPDAASLFNAADAALHRAKQAGKNRTEAFS